MTETTTTTGSGEKPLIRRVVGGVGWVCTSPDGFGYGPTPSLAHFDWCLSNLARSAQIEAVQRAYLPRLVI